MPATRAGWAQALSEPGRHIAQLYRSPAFLADAVGLYLAEGVRRGESCLVIAIPEHGDGIQAAMARHGAEPSELIAAGRLALHDAERVLSDLIDGSRLDRTRAEQVLAASLDELCTKAPLRAYGEMVMLLWRTGNAATAVELEQVWNKLLADRPVSLLCGYQLDHVGATFPSFSEACQEHVVVLPSEQYLELAPADRLTTAARLEHEAREAKAREQFINSIVDSTQDCIKVLDLDARLLYVSKGGMAALELCDFESARGAYWIDFWEEADRDAASAAVEAARRGEISQFVGYFPTMVTKQPRWWHVVVSPVRDAAGGVHQILAVSRDITDRKQLEEELRRSIDARDQFLSIASHELRTPMTSIQLQLQMARATFVKSGSLPPDRLARLLDLSMRQIRRLASLVESMLDVSSIHAGKLAVSRGPADLSRIAATAYERLRDQLDAAACNVTLDLAPELPGHWDADRIEQVVENLLANVIKYAAGSNVTLITRRSADCARLVVADRGPGVPADKHSAIFERFERVGSTRSIGGLGLGLFIARQLVEAHGGHICASDTEGGGATFTIDLPMR